MLTHPTTEQIQAILSAAEASLEEEGFDISNRRDLDTKIRELCLFAQRQTIDLADATSRLDLLAAEVRKITVARDEQVAELTNRIAFLQQRIDALRKKEGCNG